MVCGVHLRCDQCALLLRRPAMLKIPQLLCICRRGLYLHGRCRHCECEDFARRNDADRGCVHEVRFCVPCCATMARVSRIRIIGSHGRCWSGEHLPLGLLAAVSLIAVVIAFPFCTLIAWHRSSRNTEFDVDEDSEIRLLEQQIFHRSDYEFKYFWMRHAGWGVFVLIGILEEYCPVRPTSLRATLWPHASRIPLPIRRVQASIGRDIGVALITALYMGLFLWLRPFRDRHRRGSHWKVPFGSRGAVQAVISLAGGR